MAAATATVRRKSHRERRTEKDLQRFLSELPGDSPARMLTAADVARIVDVSADTLKNWRHRRVHLPFHKVGGCVRYDLADVVRFLEARRVNVDAAPRRGELSAAP